MIIYKNLNEYQDYEELIKLWNEEIGFVYPITLDLFKYNVIDNKFLSKNNSYVALSDNQLVGFIISKVWDNSSVIPKYLDTAWISLFMVKRSFRKQGIGSELLTLSEKGLFNHGYKTIHIGGDINNFFPGVPVDFGRSTTTWLEKRGYSLSYNTHDMILKKHNKPQYILHNTNFKYKIATLEDKDKLKSFMIKNFPGRWEYELEEYYKSNQQGNNYVIALEGDQVIAFARVNDSKYGFPSYNTTWTARFNNLAGIGPLGVDSAYRGIGLGYDIVAWSIDYVFNHGYEEIIIDWTGLISFYQLFNFEVWKSYTYMSKENKENKDN